MSHYNYQPVKFFFLTLTVTWISWFASSYLSYRPDLEAFFFLLLIPGLVAPALIALGMIFRSGSKDLRKDFKRRLVLPKGIRCQDISLILFLMPASILLAIAISLLFGMSPDQFRLTNQFNIINGQFFLSLLLPILAPTFEEIGWRGYGVDSLASKFSPLKTSLIFAALWSLWHVPLFFINNYYQHGLWELGILYVINFFVSIFPLTIIINWLYYKNNRSILVATLFHIVTVFSAEMFCVEESVKFLQTLLLFVVAAVIIISDKTFRSNQCFLGEMAERSLKKCNKMKSFFTSF